MKTTGFHTLDMLHSLRRLFEISSVMVAQPARHGLPIQDDRR